MQDIVIIGAGIIGCFCARDLSRYQLRITVVERENDIANETTMANSAIIHTGYDPKDGTLKAKLNVRGARMYADICKDLQVDYKACGAFVVACDEEEIETLNELKHRADQRGIPTKLLSRNQLLAQEKNLSDQVLAGLDAPDTAIINPWECAIALMEEAVLNGVELQLGCNVLSINEGNKTFIVHTNKGDIETKMVINAAGCGAEHIADLIAEQPFTMILRRGEYFVLSKQTDDYVKHIIYPTPTKIGKGVLAVPTTHGNILLGPNSEVCDEFDVSITQKGVDEVRSHLQKTLKNIPYGEVIRSFSGIRPSGNNGDFYIEASKNFDHFIHVACIDSPGLASAPAISEYVIETLIKPVMKLQKKAIHHKREPHIRMAKLDAKTRTKMIEAEPLYGKIICKCENISYQEIVDAIHSPCGAKTIKGVKKRVRPGMGKCQGGFCEVEVAKILAKELGIALQDVLYDEPHSELGSEAK